MSCLEQRQTLLAFIDQACHEGARLAQACRQIDLCARTVQRWQRPDRRDGDHRRAGQRAVVRCPANQLSAAERQAALELLSSDEFKDLPPSHIVPRLADQLYSWDITYLPTQLRGAFFYLYLFVDVFSRQIVGWQVFDCESAELASQLLLDICQRRAIAPGQLTVHSDNGSPMKGETMLAMMQRLAVAHSSSRPAVSN